ncbi:hypothetical protein BTO00_12230 [Vibrio campbellii]|uniref:hypothetical protein n=1 Tax=Vibrio campbellii TaxID=680 RepID=UPI000CF4AA79|nr:hypothetical protein [Vibrio campbellii]PQJ42800.1 hypothetical protein BTO00_12230 [Vibrio campbellii]
MSKRFSFTIVGMMFSLGMFSAEVAAHSKHHHKHGPHHHHHKHIPPRGTYIQIGNFTYLKVDDFYYKRSKDRYIHVVL